jgi:DNA-binding LacI/PurR family transcriptional regulator/DNA-binding transcriptional regulator YhcF (GntR family)
LPSAETQTPQIAQLADRLIADIVQRELQRGDRYLTAVEASRMLGVSNALANRALQLLERRQIIKRQQRLGAIIARLPSDESPCQLRRVHFLVHQQFLQSEGIGNDHVLIGMQSELPGVQVQISFLPAEAEAAFVEELISDSLKSHVVDGFVLVRTTCETQQVVAGSGLPAVVYGTIYPGVSGLARLDRDMHAVGVSLAEYLLSRGHQRIAYLNRQHTLPGDQTTLDAILTSLGRVGLPADAVTARFTPSNVPVIRATARALFLSANPPTGFICRTEPIARQVREVADELQLPSPRAEITVCDYYHRVNETPHFAYPRPTLTGEEQGQHLARLLSEKVRAVSNGAEREEIIPVELWVPQQEP